MSGCGCGCAGGGGGPFSKGRELVDFVWNAHGGTVRDRQIMGGPLAISCQECGGSFMLATYVGSCPACGGVHAVAPMNSIAENVQYAGRGYRLPQQS